MLSARLKRLEGAAVASDVPEPPLVIHVYPDGVERVIRMRFASEIEEGKS